MSPYGCHFVRRNCRNYAKWILLAIFISRRVPIFPRVRYYQRTSNVSKKNEMTLNPILEIELFDVWSIDFMRPFPPSFDKTYILLDAYYVSKSVEAIASLGNDTKVVTLFLQIFIFTIYKTPCSLVSNESTHFLNRAINKLLNKYNAHHEIVTAYHSQTNGLAEVSN